MYYLFKTNKKARTEKPGVLIKSFQDFKRRKFFWVRSSEDHYRKDEENFRKEVAPTTMVSIGISWEAIPCGKDGCVTLKTPEVNTQMLLGVLWFNSFHFFETTNACSTHTHAYPYSGETLEFLKVEGISRCRVGGRSKGVRACCIYCAQLGLLRFVNLFFLPDITPQTPGLYSTVPRKPTEIRSYLWSPSWLL